METLSAATCPLTPQTQTSHLRSTESSKASPTTAQQATRSMQQADSQQPPLSAPASQESFVSIQSAGSSLAPPLQSSSSNVSQVTSYTDLTSPPSSAPQNTHAQQYVHSTRDVPRVRMPQEDSENFLRKNDYAITSPVSVTSLASTGGTKRTASGHVKNAPSLPNTPLTATFAGSRPRADFISSAGSRAGDLAFNLKTRLGYAMAKVQHGWEHKDINEVEQLAAQKASSNRHSMSHLDHSRRPTSSGLSNGTAHLSMHDPYGRSTLDGTRSPPSKRHSGTYASFMPSSQPTFGSTPRLQPAPDIRPRTNQRQYHTAPSIDYSSAMSPPRTPVNGRHRRPPTIRTETQTAEAEREALQALFQLGSPHTSQVSWHQNASQASSSQASPLRSEFATPRKVTFARTESDGSARRSSSGDSMSEGRERLTQEA